MSKDRENPSKGIPYVTLAEKAIELVSARVRDEYGPFDERGRRSLKRCLYAGLQDVNNLLERVGAEWEAYGPGVAVQLIEDERTSWRAYLGEVRKPVAWPRGSKSRHGLRADPRPWFSAVVVCEFIDLVADHLREVSEEIPAAGDEIEEPEKMPAPAFEELTPMLLRVFSELEMIDSAGKFTGKPGEVVALYDVLKKRRYIVLEGNDVDDAFAAYFQVTFGNSCSGRHLRNPISKVFEKRRGDFLSRIEEP